MAKLVAENTSKIANDVVIGLGNVWARLLSLAKRNQV